jgi:hypothetical protein
MYLNIQQNALTAMQHNTRGKAMGNTRRYQVLPKKKNLKGVAAPLKLKASKQLI